MIWETHPFQPERPDEASDNPYLAYLQAIDAWARERLGERDQPSQEGIEDLLDESPFVSPDHEALQTVIDTIEVGRTSQKVGLDIECHEKRLPAGLEFNGIGHDIGVQLTSVHPWEETRFPTPRPWTLSYVQYGYDIVGVGRERTLRGVTTIGEIQYHSPRMTLTLQPPAGMYYPWDRPLRPIHSRTNPIHHGSIEVHYHPEECPHLDMTTDQDCLTWQWKQNWGMDEDGNGDLDMSMQKTVWTLSDFAEEDTQSIRYLPRICWDPNLRNNAPLTYETVDHIEHAKGSKGCDWWDRIEDSTYSDVMLEVLLRSKTFN